MKSRFLAVSFCAVSLLALSLPFAQAQGGKTKPQEQVAAKGALPTVKASDVKVKSAHSASDLAGAKKMAGKSLSVTGTVASIFVPGGNNVVLINLSQKYAGAVTGVVLAKDYAKFPPLKQLKGKKVLLSGYGNLY